MQFIYITPLFLYFPRFLTSIETQPLLVTLVAVFGLVFGRNRRAALAFVGLGCVLMFWIAVRIGLGGTFSSSIGLIQILIGPLILLGLLALRAPPPSRRLIAGVTIYFVVCAALEILSPVAYYNIASTILSRANVSDGHRGISLLTPEPTYAAISVFYFLMLAWWSGKYWGFRIRWIEPILVFCLMATGSTYVILLLLALACVHWPRQMFLLTIITFISVPLIGVSALGNDDSIRAVVAISRIISIDFSDFLPAISMADSSVGSRLVTNAASFLTIVHSPLGLGLNCEALPKALDAAGYEFAFQNEALIAALENGCLKPQSYTATVVIGLGALSLVFFPLLITLILGARGTVRRRFWTAPLVLAGVMLVVQAQLSSPIPWFLIFLGLNSDLIRQKIQPISERVIQDK